MTFDEYMNWDLDSEVVEESTVTAPVVSWQEKAQTAYIPSSEYYELLADNGIVKTDMRRRAEVFAIAYNAANLKSESAMDDMIADLFELVMSPVAIEYKKSEANYRQVRTYKISAAQVSIFANILRNQLIGC